MHYDLTHLTHDVEYQNDLTKLGPIQDDEALFLYALIIGMRIKSVFEIGGLHGYSTTNFLKAVGEDGIVFTCDWINIKKINQNHITIRKNALNVTPEDVNNHPIELIFFDCHSYDIQMGVLDRFIKNGLITEESVIALHDTNTHPQKNTGKAYLTSQGYVFQPDERKMANTLVERGYHAFSLHSKNTKHPGIDGQLFRHGLTILTRFKKFDPEENNE